MLSTNDKEVIETLTKKLALAKSEFDSLIQKYGALQRNYESISNFAASDKADYMRLKNMKESYEKEA